MRRALVAIFFALTITNTEQTLAGEKSRPQFFQPCAMISTYSPAAHSFAAIRIALRDRNWHVTRQDQQAYQIEAHNCNRLPGTVMCPSVTFAVDASGRVSAWLTDPEPTPNNVLNSLGRRMRFLERAFNHNSCLTDEIIQSMVLPLGIVVLPICAAARNIPEVPPAP